MPRSSSSFKTHAQSNPGVVAMYGAAWLQEQWTNFPKVENETDEDITQRLHSTFNTENGFSHLLKTLLETNNLETNNPDPTLDNLLANLLTLQDIAKSIKKQSPSEKIDRIIRQVVTEKEHKALKAITSLLITPPLNSNYQAYLLGLIDTFTVRAMAQLDFKKLINLVAPTESFGLEFQKRQQALANIISDPSITLPQMKKTLCYHYTLEYQRLEAASARPWYESFIRWFSPTWRDTPAQTILSTANQLLSVEKVPMKTLKTAYELTVNASLKQVLKKIWEHNGPIGDDERKIPIKEWAQVTDANSDQWQQWKAIGSLALTTGKSSSSTRNNTINDLPIFVQNLIGHSAAHFVNQLPEDPWFTNAVCYGALQQLPADFYTAETIALMRALPVPFIEKEKNLAVSLQALTTHPHKQAIVTIIKNALNEENTVSYLNQPFTLVQLLQVDHDFFNEEYFDLLPPMLTQSNTTSSTVAITIKPTDYQRIAHTTESITQSSSNSIYTAITSTVQHYWSPSVKTSVNSPAANALATNDNKKPHLTSDQPCHPLTLALAAFATLYEKSPCTMLFAYFITMLPSTSTKK